MTTAHRDEASSMTSLARRTGSGRLKARDFRAHNETSIGPWPWDKTSSPTDWSQRGFVRIDSLNKRRTGRLAFLIAATSAEWIVTLRFFVPRNTFKEETLKTQLGLLPFHESPVPVLSDAPRVKLTNDAMFQEITITGFALADFQTEGFDAFLKKAVAAFVRWGEASKLKKASEL